MAAPPFTPTKKGKIMNSSKIASVLAYVGPSAVVLAIGAGAFLSAADQGEASGASVPPPVAKEAKATETPEQVSKRVRAERQQSAASAPQIDSEPTAARARVLASPASPSQPTADSAPNRYQPPSQPEFEDYRWSMPYRDWQGMSADEQRENAWRRCSDAGTKDTARCGEAYGPAPADRTGDPWRGWEEADPNFQRPSN